MSTPTHPRSSGPGPVTAVYGALWAATAVGVVLTAAGPYELTSGTPRDALPARLSIAIELVADNAPVALWPLALLALGWASLPIARTLGDVLVTAQVLGHGLLVGSALGTHPELWRYLPHLPVEWLALAIPVAAWVAVRVGRPAQPIRNASLTVALVVVAALLETYAVPI